MNYDRNSIDDCTDDAGVNSRRELLSRLTAGQQRLFKIDSSYSSCLIQCMGHVTLASFEENFSKDDVRSENSYGPELRRHLRFENQSILMTPNVNLPEDCKADGKLVECESS
eukprot:TRINITY_DN4790_c0_g3_i1.p2 TRINITY_DN4790_c0_g3~~TRINITY_DN4790_c0_g3_i1.p2  ORF type:complete len:112 (-),score=5.31 TRINITY_DN4790_c0_g3_i1:372-707(-)